MLRTKIFKLALISGWLAISSLWIIQPVAPTQARAGAGSGSGSFPGLGAKAALTSTVAVPDSAEATASATASCPAPADAEPSLAKKIMTNFLLDRAIDLAETLEPAAGPDGPANILLIGSDSERARQKYSRTDTLILATIDGAGKTGGLLSIPRDLWVTIPGHGENRINQAYRLGEMKHHPGGGPALLQETITANFGVPVHFYILVDFEGFQQIIETLGGLDICVPKTIDAASYYGYSSQFVDKEAYYGFVPLLPGHLPEDRGEGVMFDPAKGYQFLYIEAGHHRLDANTALRYARSRASGEADFGRVQRQQAILLAIRNQALQMDVIPKIPKLWNTMRQAVKTNLELGHVLQLARLAYEIPLDQIKMGAIGRDETMSHTTAEGANVLLPKMDAIQPLITPLTSHSSKTVTPIPAKVDVQSPAPPRHVTRQEERLDPALWLKPAK